MADHTVREPAAILRACEWLLYPLLYAVALLPRILQPAVFVAGDELNWAFRSFQFWQALDLGNGRLHGAINPAGTVALWASALGPALGRLLAGAGPAPRWLALSGVSSLDPQSIEMLRQAAALWPLAKLPTVAFCALLLTFVAWLAARLWGRRVGALTGLALAIAPYHLALSRLLGPEAITAGLALAALLALLWALRRPDRWWGFLLAGAAAGMAVLNGKAAAPLLPYGLLLLVGAQLLQRQAPARIASRALLWCLAVLMAALLAWPAAYGELLAEALRALAQQLVSGLGWGLNRETLAGVAMRIPPLTLVGLALGVLMLPFRPQSDQSGWGKGWVVAGAYLELPGVHTYLGSALALLGYAVVTVLFGRQGSPEDPRWALPALIALDVAAALGMGRAIALAGRGLARISLPPRMGPALHLSLSAAAVLAFAWQGLAVWSYRPYYAAYRNPWLDGLAGEARMSWGEGLEKAVHYLNAQANAGQLSVASPHLPVLATYFVGEGVALTPETLLSADYVLLYRSDWEQPAPPLRGLVARQPVRRFQVRGVEYARLYANRTHEPVLQVLSGAIRPDDVVILDALTPLQRHYRGAAPLYLFQVSTAEQAAAELARLATGRYRLWHVAFAGADPRHILDELLETQAMLVQRWPVDGAVVSLYLLPLQPHFHALEPTQALNLPLGPSLTLARVGLSAAQVQYRQRVSVAIEWQLLSRPERNLALSLRLRDAQGRTWAQQDRWLTDAAGRSTAAWPEQGQVETRHGLAAPAAAPPGTYHLQGTVYEVDTLQPVGAAFDLGTLDVLPAQLPPTLEELELPIRLQAPLAPGVELLGLDIGEEALLPGQALPIRLWWRTTQPVTVTYRAQLILLDAKGHERANRVVELAGTQHPTPLWIGGEVIEGRYTLPVDVQAAPGEALLGVQLVGVNGPVNEPVRVGSVEVLLVEHSFTKPKIANPRLETIDQKVRLLGYDAPLSAGPGETLLLTLYWQALAPMTGNYTVFTHVIDERGKVLAGHDSLPVAGERPTNSWVLHEVLTDTHPIPLPGDLPLGEYALEVGLYDAATGVRLPAYDSSATRLPLDRVLLGKVKVE